MDYKDFLELVGYEDSPWVRFEYEKFILELYNPRYAGVITGIT